jgi:hypothetical protein
MVDARCPECGAPLLEGRDCRANLEALLAIEWQVPGGPGTVAHFYAVASYNLQHPDLMRLTAETLAGLRASVADMLAGRVTLEDVRRRARRGAKAAGRVTRRGDEQPQRLPVAEWTMTVGDVLARGVEGYADHVEAWARSVLADIEAGEAAAR